MPVVTALPQHDRPARPALDAAAAEPPDRRRARHRAPASSTGCCYGCGDAVIGINPATDSPERDAAPARDARRRSDQRYDIPTQILRAGPRHDARCEADRAAARRSTWCSSRSPAPRPRTELRRQPGAARRGARGGAGARARHRRRQRHVLRDRPGQRAVGRRAPRRRPADAARRAPTPWRARSSRCWSTPSSASSAPSTCTTASRSSAPAWRTTSAASCWACRWAATSATPTTPRPTRTTWTRC